MDATLPAENHVSSAGEPAACPAVRRSHPLKDARLHKRQRRIDVSAIFTPREASKTTPASTANMASMPSPGGSGTSTPGRPLSNLGSSLITPIPRPEATSDDEMPTPESIVQGSQTRGNAGFTDRISNALGLTSENRSALHNFASVSTIFLYGGKFTSLFPC